VCMDAERANIQPAQGLVYFDHLGLVRSEQNEPN